MRSSVSQAAADVLAKGWQFPVSRLRATTASKLPGSPQDFGRLLRQSRVTPSLALTAELASVVCAGPATRKEYR
jgi:hypothetical protein